MLFEPTYPPFLRVRASCINDCKQTNCRGSLKLYRFEPTGLVHLDYHDWDTMLDCWSNMWTPAKV